MIIAVIAILFVLPRLQAGMVKRVDEKDLGRKALESLARTSRIERLDAGLPVRLLQQFGRQRSLRVPHYTVHRSDEGSVNAMALPGGIVIVTAGLLQLVESGGASEAELAAVLAHEVAHIELGHSREAEVRDTISGWATRALPVGGLVYGLVVKAGMTALQRRSSREAEREADLWAADLLDETGHGAEALASFLSRSEQWRGGLWSTHPSPPERIEALKARRARRPS